MSDDAGALHLSPDDLCKVTAGVLAGVRDELRALFEATAKGPASPPPGRPPVVLDDIDAKSFERLKGDLLGAVQGAVRDATQDFLPEEDIDQRIAIVTKSLDDRLDRFKRDFLDDVRSVVKEEIGKIQTEWYEIFQDLKMPLEKGEKRIATREKLADLWAMQDASKQWKSEFWKAIRTTSISGVVASIVAFLTYIFTRGGPPH